MFLPKETKEDEKPGPLVAGDPAAPLFRLFSFFSATPAVLPKCAGCELVLPKETKEDEKPAPLAAGDPAVPLFRHFSFFSATSRGAAEMRGLRAGFAESNERRRKTGISCGG
jgi:hypothetical protein